MPATRFHLRRLASIAMALLCLKAAALANTHDPRPNVIWAIDRGSAIDISEFLEVIRQNPIVIIGETHGVAEHQNREAFVLGALADKGIYPSLGLEMISHDQEAQISGFRSQSPEDASGLGERLDWSASGWPDYSYYRPVFDIAFRAKLPIFGIDLTEEEKRVGSSKATLGSDSLRRSWSESMMTAHCNLIEEPRLTEVVNLQMARDAYMAKSAEGFGPVILIVGSEHARKDRGVPAILKSDGKTALSIALVSYSPESQKRYVDSHLYDYVWFTPESTKEDVCDRLRSKGLIKIAH